MSRLQRAVARQHTLTLLLWLALAGLLAWFGEQFDHSVDLTAAGRHTLGAESQALLAALEPAPSFTLYARPGPERRKIEKQLAHYAEARPGLSVELVDPDLEPARTRAADVTFNGELQIAWGGRTERLYQVNESLIANALQRLHHGGTRPLRYLVGHGERDLQGLANHDLGLFGSALAQRGLRFAPLNLAEEEPQADALVLIAGPERDLLPGETARLLAHLQRGGNLLWLLDSGPLRGLEPLAEVLALQLPAGELIDPRSAELGITQPKVALVSRYARVAPVEALEQVALLIDARPLLGSAPTGWQRQSLFSSDDKSRLQLGEDADAALPGPFPLGVAFSRALPSGEGEQRLVVVGDADLLSNSYLGNQGNQALGEALVAWLATPEQTTLTLAPRRAPDQALNLSPASQSFLGLFFLILLPGGLALSGLWLWRRRQRS